MQRLFFALTPDEATRRRCADLARRLAAERAARWVSPRRYHLTLAFLGRRACFAPACIDGLRAAAQAVRAGPFTWQADHVAAFPGHRPPCVLAGRHCNAALQRLRDGLVDALAERGLLPDEGSRPYRPHVTLGYGLGNTVGTEPLPEPLTWPAAAFRLLLSVDGEPSYRELGCWPLRG